MRLIRLTLLLATVIGVVGCSYTNPGSSSRALLSGDASSKADSPAFYRQMFVAFLHSPGGGHGQVAVFRNTANGNVAPLRVLVGPDTGLFHPSSVATDDFGNMWVANGTSSDATASLTVYSSGASGDTPPTSTVKGDRTQLFAPTGIATRGTTIYVASTGNRANGGSACECILEFNRFQKGNAVPIAVIGGPDTRITQPRGIFVDPGGSIWVADSDNEILAFSYGSNGDVAPFIDITGPNTLLNGDEALAQNGSEEVFVAQQGSYLAFARGANGDATPVADVTGPATDMVGSAEGIDLKGSDVYVSFWNNCTCTDGVKTFPQNANGNVAPLRDLKGRRTGFNRFMLKNVIVP